MSERRKLSAASKRGAVAQASRPGIRRPGALELRIRPSPADRGTDPRSGRFRWHPDATGRGAGSSQARAGACYPPSAATQATQSGEMHAGSG